MERVSALSLGKDVKNWLSTTFKMLVDCPEEVLVEAFLEEFKTPEPKYGSVLGLRFEVFVKNSDYPAAIGKRGHIIVGIKSVMSSIKGKNRIPMTIMVRSADSQEEVV